MFLQSRRSFSDRLYSPIFAAPAFVIFFVFFVVPVITGFGYSFTNWNQYLTEIEFVGLDNFRQIFQDKVSTLALKNTLIFATVTTVGKNVLGLCLALLLNSKLKGKSFWRAVYFSPAILSTIVVGLIFSAVLHPSGLLNDVLNFFGLNALNRSWLTDKNIVMFTVSAVEIWMYAGFHMAIYLAGLQSIPHELIEAARIDGISPWQQFRYIIFPLIIPSFNINLVMALIGGFKVFDMVYVLTNGGPGFASQVVSTVVYKAFGEGRWGYGTALNLVLFAIISLIVLTVLNYLRRNEVEY